jgi:hypothetical protein
MIFGIQETGEALVTHGDGLDRCSTVPHGLPGTARRRMAVGVAAGQLYEAAMARGDLDITLAGLQEWVGDETMGLALFHLLDACHALLDC